MLPCNPSFKALLGIWEAVLYFSTLRRVAPWPSSIPASWNLLYENSHILHNHMNQNLLREERVNHPCRWGENWSRKILVFSSCSVGGLHPVDHSGIQWGLMDKSQLYSILGRSSSAIWPWNWKDGAAEELSVTMDSFQPVPAPSFMPGIELCWSFSGTFLLLYLTPLPTQMPFIPIVSHRPSAQFWTQSSTKH